MKENLGTNQSSARKAEFDVCESCQRSEDPREVLCLVNRLDQGVLGEVPCAGYQKKE